MPPQNAPRSAWADALPTHAPTFLGGLAASLAAVEVAKLRAGARDGPAVGAEVLLDLRHHVLQVSRRRRAAACRFDHATWSVTPVGDVALRDAFALAGDPERAELGVPGDAFAAALRCPGCGRCDPIWRLRSALDAETLACPACGARRRASGFDLVERVRRERAPSDALERSLGELGLRPGEVFELRDPGGAAHFELARPGAVPVGPDALLAGCGNIGSFLVPHLARLPGLERITLVDPDRYEAAQVRTQNALPRDVGRPKAVVQAERLRAIDPSLAVRAVVAPLEELPTGHFRSGVVISALDSRLARLHLAERAWRMASPFVDTAIDAGAWLARVDVTLPGPGAPCLECGWGDDDYAALEQRAPCADAAEEA